MACRSRWRVEPGAGTFIGAGSEGRQYAEIATFGSAAWRNVEGTDAAPGADIVSLMRARVGTLIAGVVLVSLAGCTRQIPEPAPPSTIHSTVTNTLPASTGSDSTVVSTVDTTVRSTVTKTSVQTATPPPPTKEPPAQAGDCPYLSTDDVATITVSGPARP